jgi:hypothetical protein
MKLQENDLLDVDGKIILKWTSKKQDGSVEWIYLARDIDQWWALVNTTLSLLFP